MLNTAVRRGEVRRLLRGVYVGQQAPDSVDLRIAATALAVPPGQVAIDRTAAWLHGIDVLDTNDPGRLPPVEMCAVRWHPATTRVDVLGRTRDLVPEDVTEVAGIAVTTPLRTALDLGCNLRRRDALAALDQFRGRFGITQDDLARGAVRFFRRRGVVQLRALIQVSDPRAESPRESWTRLAILDAGLPAPVPQYEVELDGVVLLRLDHAYPAARVAVEYDGVEFHHTPEQIAHDERRRRWLAEKGWRVVVVRVGDFSGPRLDQWLARLRMALQPPYTNLRW